MELPKVDYPKIAKIITLNTHIEQLIKLTEALLEEKNLSKDENKTIKSYKDSLKNAHKKLQEKIEIKEKPEKSMSKLTEYITLMQNADNTLTAIMRYKGINEEGLYSKAYKTKLQKEQIESSHKDILEYKNNLLYFFSIIKRIYELYKNSYEGLFKFLVDEKIVNKKTKKPGLPKLFFEVYIKSDYLANSLATCDPKGYIYLHKPFFTCIETLKENYWLDAEQTILHELVHFLQSKKSNEILVDSKGTKFYKAESNEKLNKFSEANKMKARDSNLTEIERQAYDILDGVYFQMHYIYGLLDEEKEGDLLIKLSKATSEISNHCLKFSKLMKQLDKDKTIPNRDAIISRLNDTFKTKFTEFYDKNRKWRYEEIFTNFLLEIIAFAKDEIIQTAVEGGAEAISIMYLKKVKGVEYDYSWSVYKGRTDKALDKYALKKNFLILEYLHKLEMPK